MRFAILIVTYTSPEQTKRLVESLNNGDFDFYIHVDKKLDMDSHRELFDIPNVYFIKNRIDIKWAAFSFVEAILNGIREITATGVKYDFISLISGQDYPVKSASYISNFLSRNVGKEFILYKYFETEWAEARARIEKYHFTDFKFKGRHQLEKFINRIAPKRKFPIKNLELCGKETFWTLSPACAVYVMNYIDSNKKLRKFLKYTWGSDEFIFQTIMMDSPFKANVVNNNYRYIIWPPGQSRPKVLLTEDFENIMASDCLFGRKFDINKDRKILDLIDKQNSL